MKLQGFKSDLNVGGGVSEMLTPPFFFKDYRQFLKICKKTPTRSG